MVTHNGILELIKTKAVVQTNQYFIYLFFGQNTSACFLGQRCCGDTLLSVS